MMKSIFVRIGLSLVFAVPAALGIFLLVSIVAGVMVGPWGGALETPRGEDRVGFNKTLVALLNVMLVVGPLVLGWSWAGRFLDKRRKRDASVNDEAGAVTTGTVDCSQRNV